MLETLIKILMCHMLGDYVIQIDYLSQNKGKDWYILFAHCVTYAFPFAVLFGFDYKCLIVILTHFVVDALKARYHKINLFTDQLIHYVTALILYMI